MEVLDTRPSSDAWSSLVNSKLLSLQQVSPKSSAEMVSHARQMLDQEISDAVSVVGSFKTLRNSLLPIHRLPPDILFKIFYLLATLETPSDLHITLDSGKKVFQKHRPLDVYKVTHVCRHWKEVALQFPMLWTKIPLHHAQWADMFLLRSQGAPLSLFIDSSKDLSPATNAALGQIHRLQKLSLQGDISSPPALLTAAAPILESVTLDHLDPKSYRYYHDGPASSSPIASNLFGQDTPMLRRLIIHRTWPFWGWPILNNLTHLEIHLNSYKSISSRTTAESQASLVDEVTDALRRMSSLTTLILDHSVPAFPPDATLHPSANRDIQLPFLTYLSLAGPLLDCLLFTQRLAIHPDASVSYDCYKDGRAIPDDICSTLLSPASRITSRVPQALFVKCNGLRLCFKVWATHDLDVNDVEKWDEKPYIALNWDGASGPSAVVKQSKGVVAREMQTLFQLIPIDTVRVLMGDLESSVLGDGGWHGVWRRAISVEKVHVRDSFPSFLEAFVEPIPEVTPAQYLFPRLKVLCIEGVRLTGDIDHRDLMMAIKDRKYVGLILDKLVIINCKIIARQIEALRKVVKTIQWDKGRWDKGDESEEY